MPHACLVVLILVNCTHQETPHAEPKIVAVVHEEPVAPKLAALKGEWIEHRDDGWFIPPLGATEARPLIVARKHPDHWPVVALVEGGYDETKWGFGAAFAKGGKRVLFACSTWHCAEGYRDGERSSIAAKVDARVADLGNLGHHMGTPVRDGLRAQFRWLVRDDERWEAWLESP